MPRLTEDVKTGPQRQAIFREDMTLTDMESIFLSIGIGEYQEFKIAKMQRVTGGEPKFNLYGTDYKVEIVTTDEKILSINAWALLNEIKAACKKAKRVQGLHLIVKHPADSKYTVEIQSDPELP